MRVNNILGNQMEKKVYEILSNILEIEVNENTNITMQECNKWTSLAHIDIIMSVEEAFDITFNEHQLITLNTQQNIIKALKELLNV